MPAAAAIYINYSTCNLTSSIVANNAPTDVSDSYGTVNASASLIETTGGHAIADGVDGNIVGHDPVLFPLGVTAGLPKPTPSRRAVPASTPAATPIALTTDQRGAGLSPREVGTVDIGAVEYMTNTTLAVTFAGNGIGTVSSSPAGIDCGSRLRGIL